MNQNEHANIIIGLRLLGWSDTKINDFMLFVETGDKSHIEDAKKEKENK